MEDPELGPEGAEFSDDHQSNYDQMQENVLEVGLLASNYLTYLREFGFNRSEAFELVRDWHGSFWSGAHNIPFDLDGLDDD